MRSSRDTSPRRYSPLLALGLLVAGGLVLLAIVLALRDAVDPLRRAEAWYAYERAQRINEELSTLDTMVAAGWRLLPLMLVTGAGGVGLLALYHRLAARRFVEADKLIALQRAQRQQFPDSLQTLAFHDSSRQDRALLPEPAYGEEEGEELEARPVPTFAQLLDAGKVGRGNPLMLGIGADGAPVEGSWLDLFSVGIGGLSGSGKSWTGTYLLSQAMLHGARVAILDPHSNDAESISQRLAPLHQRFICDPASDARAQLAVVRLVTDELNRRKGGSTDRSPLVIVGDEFSALMRGDLAEPLALLFEAIAQEGRKLGIYGLALGQSWTASRSGGTELRDSLASCYIHRLRPAQARYLSGLTADELPADVLELPSGTAYLLSTRGELQRLTIPRMVSADVVRVAGMLSADAPTMPRIRAASAQPLTAPAVDAPRPSSGPAADAVSESAASAPERATPALDADTARVLALFASGATVHDLVTQVHGVTNPGSRAYKDARRAVEETIRAALGEVRR